MSVTAAKSKAPIESSIASPINEAVEFTPGNTIIFRIGAADLLYWLVQDSYFVFDVDWSRTSNTAPARNLVIRNSSMFFNNVRIIHAGNEVYYSQYNIAQQFLDLIKSGDDYLQSQYHEWTNHKTYDRAVGDVVNYPLILRASEWGTNTSLTKKGYVMHVGQILKCFSQIENFPLKYLTQQIEIRLQLAQPNEFVCAVTADANNFYDLQGNAPSTNGASAENEGVAANYTNLTYKITNMRLYMFGAQVEPSYDAVQGASNATGQGTCWKYQMPRINLRNEPARANAQYLISNFQCITENTNELYIWAVRHNNLATAIRPKVNNCNIRFGPYQMPKSPTAEDNWLKPCLYKQLVDDTLEYSTAYYTSANADLYKSYPVVPASQTIISTSANNCTPHDTNILIAGSFTTDDNQPGSNSKAWNSQYNLHYQLMLPESAWTWVLAVTTDYVLTLRQGMLSSTNI